MLARWWAIRTEAVGAIGDHCINVSGILVSVAARVLVNPEDWLSFKDYHCKIVKYGLASMSCVVMEAHKEADAGGPEDDDPTKHQVHRLEKLLELGLLSELEKNTLEQCTCHASCLWSWITALSVEALEAMKVPAPNINMLYQEVRNAMGGIHNAHNYLGTQLPFPYVHMITLLVNVNSLVICVVSGVQCAIGSQRGEIAVCVCNVAKIYMLPVLYQALLQICVFLSDPFGDDIIDFPIRAFQRDVSQACEDHLCLRIIYEQRFLDKESLPPQQTFMQELRQPAPLVPSISLEKAAPPADTGTQQAMVKLDQRLQTLSENALSLTQSMSALQEMLTQSNNTMATTAGNLQAQVKELTSGLSAAAQLRPPPTSMPPRALPWDLRNPRAPGQPTQDPFSHCCSVVQPASGPEAIHSQPESVS